MLCVSIFLQEIQKQQQRLTQSYIMISKLVNIVKVLRTMYSIQETASHCINKLSSGFLSFLGLLLEELSSSNQKIHFSYKFKLTGLTLNNMFGKFTKCVYGVYRKQKKRNISLYKTEFWVIIMCQCSLINCKKCTILVGNVDNGRSHA